MHNTFIDKNKMMAISHSHIHNIIINTLSTLHEEEQENHTLTNMLSMLYYKDMGIYAHTIIW